MMRIGTLYGIGVGPGDPELITLKAARILQQVSVVFAASSTKNSYSLARDIASVHLRKGIPVKLLEFPMTKQKEILDIAWHKNAGLVLDALKTGKDVAFITLGDPMTYSTFGYIMQTIQETDPDVPIKVIPGITSYQAAAASAGQVLAEGEESFTVISGAMGAKGLKEIIDHTDSVVILKVYRHFDEIMDTLEHLRLKERAVLISRCGLDDEEILSGSHYDTGFHPPYLSLLILHKRNCSHPPGRQ